LVEFPFPVKDIRNERIWVLQDLCLSIAGGESAFRLSAWFRLLGIWDSSHYQSET
jgi:hypothetical protein